MSNRIEIASSGRATCKICQRRINKGTARFGLEAYFRGRETVKWHHLSCAINKYPGEIASSWMGSGAIAQMTAEQKETIELLTPISKEVFYSNTWQRDTMVYVYFDTAKSNRAKCKYCGEKIIKGEPKIVKPLVGFRDENIGASYMSYQSYHLECAIKDEHGEELIHEGITRLNGLILKEQKEKLKEWYETLPEIKGKEILGEILKND